MKKTKLALMQSMIALLLCFSMLMGTTYAWFTDSVTSNNNVIVAGNLDVELQYSTDFENWSYVNSESNIFDTTLWEPGHTEVVYLKVMNAGNLALQYRLGVNIVSESGSVNQAGENFLLSDYIQFGAVTDVTAAYATRGEARNAVATAQKISAGFQTSGSILNNGADQYVALIVWMPEEVGNAANYATGMNPPEIKLGINLYATQEQAELDSFDETYDSGASLPIENLHVNVQMPVAAELISADNTLTEAVTVGSAEGDIFAEVPADVKLADGATSLTLSVNTMAESQANVTLVEGENATPIDVHVDGVAADNTQPMLITLKGLFAPGLNEGNYKLYHVENGVTQEMICVANPVNHNEFSYDGATGNVTMMMASFSEVLVVSNAKNYWNGEAATGFERGTGAENDPYVIMNAQQLAYFRDQVDGGKTFVDEFVQLGANICLEGYDAKGNRLCFDPIGWGYEKSSWNRDVDGDGNGDAGKVFKGTFDGGYYIEGVYHTAYIFGLYQNGWDLEASTKTDYTYTNCGFGLFGAAYGATFKNLTITGANIRVECVEAGVLVGLAQGGCTFENIKIYGCKIANYQRPAGGVVGEVSSGGTHRFINVSVDNKTVVGSMWGDFDAPLGGVIGAYWDDAGETKVEMNDCHIGCVIDAYSDVTSAYQWYAYRRAGMLIGNSDRSKTEASGRTVATADYLKCTDVHIYYGDWINYHYCQFTNQSGTENASWQNNYPWVRVEVGENCSAYSNPRYGHPVVNGVAVTDDNHTCTSTHQLTIPFGQLYGGGQGVYGGGQEVKDHYNDDINYDTYHDGVVIEGKNYIITMMSDDYVVNLMVLIDGTSAPDFNGKDFNTYKLEAEGKAFAGWVDEDGNPVTSATFGDLKKDVTIYANWADYTVTYMNQGEVYAVVGLDRGQQYTVGSDVVKLADRTQDGKKVTFKAWVNAAGNKVETITVSENVVVYDSWNGIYTARFVDQLGNLVDEVEFVEGDKTLKYTPSLDLVDLNQKDVTVAWESYTLGKADIVVMPVYTYDGGLKLVPVDNEPKDGRTDYYQVEAVDTLPEDVYVPGYIGYVAVERIEKLTDDRFATNVKTVTINEGTIYLGHNALAGTGNLEIVYLPESLKELDKNVFSYNTGGWATKRITIVYPGGVDDWANNVKKDSDWHNGLLEDSIVQCSDGYYKLKRGVGDTHGSYTWELYRN